MANINLRRVVHPACVKKLMRTTNHRYNTKDLRKEAKDESSLNIIDEMPVEIMLLLVVFWQSIELVLQTILPAVLGHLCPLPLHIHNQLVMNTCTVVYSLYTIRHEVW